MGGTQRDRYFDDEESSPQVGRSSSLNTEELQETVN